MTTISEHAMSFWTLDDPLPLPDHEFIRRIYGLGRDLCSLIRQRQKTGEPVDEYAALLRRTEEIRKDWLELWQPTARKPN